MQLRTEREIQKVKEELDAKYGKKIQELQAEYERELQGYKAALSPDYPLKDQLLPDWEIRTENGLKLIQAAIESVKKDWRKAAEIQKAYLRAGLDGDIQFLNWCLKNKNNKWCSPQEAQEALERIDHIREEIEAL